MMLKAEKENKLTSDVKYSKDVELIWRHKNSILEDGQSREEKSKSEIFLDQLSEVEIKQLLEPKILTNAKFYDQYGTKSLEKFNRDPEINRRRGLAEDTITDNLIIKANNLMGLSSLLSNFKNKVKFIYIDPPYNTGSNSFIYNDSFKLSTWLTFMKNRIDLAKKLLAPGGVFIVQCSTHYYAYLKILMDETFEKHLCDFVVQVRHPERIITADKEFNDIIEYILIYTNDKNRKMPFIKKEKTIDDYSLQIVIKEGEIPEVIQCGSRSVEVYLPHQYQVITVSPSKQGLKRVKISGGIREKNSSGRFFVKYLEKLEGYPPETLFKVPDLGDDHLGYRFFYLAPKGKKCSGYFQGMPQSSNFTRKPYPNLLNFSKEYKNVFKQGGVSFRNGKKPEELLEFLIANFTSADDIVLDYHLGSGTTAAVAHKLRRQYIGIEHMDFIETIAVERLKSVIHGEQTGISKSVNWQGGGDFVYFELKKYNQGLIKDIDDSQNTQELLKIWQKIKDKSFFKHNVDLQKFEENIEKFKNFEIQKQKDILYEILEKNQLYVNISSLYESGFNCTEEEKRVTQNFYQKKNF